MIYSITIGLLSEGTTDQLFLASIIKRTFYQEAFFCSQLVDIEDIEFITKGSGSFSETVQSAIQSGVKNFNMKILCVHADADSKSVENVMKNKFSKIINETDIPVVPVIPIQETEAWMLADRALLKAEIGTTKSDLELGIHRAPETIANPKEVIENAIRVARADLAKKRRKEFAIGDLYLAVGQSIDLLQLENLPSYQHFKENVRNAFRSLNLLH